jgi:UDP-N-acetylmuramoylalanine--D-glutamate ligase
LIEILLKTTFPHTFACGNIGVPVADILTNEPIASNLVMELSSFQLEGTLTFRPSISVLLNITPAHIDFHENFEHYVQAKTKITKNQKETDYVVYNIENTYTKKIAESSNATCIPFSVNSYHQKGACVKDGWIHYEGSKFLSVSELALPGKHNLENILASIIVSKLSGVPNEKIINILKTFTGVNHRLKYVGEFNERIYYNDSKATNSLAVKNAVSSFDKKPILIAGGLDRGNSYDDLVDVFKQCKYVLLIGESANRMYKIAQKHHLTNVFVAYDLPRAVTQSKTISSIGDVILLSPACASWDQYSSFEVRGDHFIELIYKGN